MAFIDIFTWIVFLIMISVVVGIIVFMGLWPGRIAKTRQHPQAEAITIGSWVCLLFGGVMWPLMLIWAYTKPSTASQQADTIMLAQKVALLQTRLEALERQKGENQ
ncbi:DUF3302 domain-containing protein [Teredinibacter franksiae]|uniref:DUF3302 domain-containing protein n=1 Tax=Teredinibacter franksiae TaxID=2761453 RepID=UPI00162A0762|nr:DUF3302 domain-containing protein [Teredinibacter franksiae]